MSSLTQYIDLYRQYVGDICHHSPSLLNDMRTQALQRLTDATLPTRGQETYPALSVDEMFATDYGVNINRVNFPVDTTQTFRCGVPNVSTLMAMVVNDTFVPTSTLVRNLPQGVVMMSLAKACNEMPELVMAHLGQLSSPDDVVANLNTLLLQDGVLIYVPDNIHLDRPLQLVNIFNSLTPLMGVRRVLVIVGNNASAQILVCDHSQLPEVQYLSNTVTEIYVGCDSTLEYYDLEESSAKTSRYSTLYARQQRGSSLTVNGTTLVGGITRNNYVIDIVGDHADTRLAGMAIGADNQIIDNTTDIRHHSCGSSSDQMFKYVLDQQSTGSFYGTIVVDEPAKYTKAYQSNRNILASDDARMYTRPQLEIYCDEVKCSHGATVGQLDANALFYMQSRGIPATEARLMLMQAFMADVIDTVTIPALRTRLQQLTEARLCGSHTLCADCTLG